MPQIPTHLHPGCSLTYCWEIFMGESVNSFRSYFSQHDIFSMHCSEKFLSHVKS